MSKIKTHARTRTKNSGQDENMTDAAEVDLEAGETHLPSSGVGRAGGGGGGAKVALAQSCEAGLGGG